MQLIVYLCPLICREHHSASCLWSLIEVSVPIPKPHKRLVWISRFVAIYTPNCRLVCMKQSNHQSWNWCSHTHCLCCFSCLKTCRNCHIHHFPIVQKSWPESKISKLSSVSNLSAQYPWLTFKKSSRIFFQFYKKIFWA